MKSSKKTVVIKTIIILFFITGLIIVNRLIMGNTFKIKLNNRLDTYVSHEVRIDDESILEVKSMTYENNALTIVLKGKKPGNTQVEYYIQGENNTYQGYATVFYVHKSGLITENSYIGTTNNFYIIGIEFVLFLLILFIHRVIMCIKIARDNMYSYSLTGNMGVALFLLLSLVLFTLISIRQGRLFYRIYILLDVMAKVFLIFSFLALPILIIVSLFLLVSNIVLIKHEGKKLTNILGILLGFGLFMLTFLGNFVYSFIFNNPTKNVHFNYYVSFFIDAFFYSLPVYLECLLVSTLVCTVRAQKHVPKPDKDFIIILGCSIMKDGSLTPLLKGRADRALWFAKYQKDKSGKDIIFVPSGGQGSDEIISEAQAVKNYLLSKGVDEEHILLEDKSTNTQENMEFSRRLIEERKKDAKVAFSTTGYHVFRSGNIARKMGFKASGVGSKTKWYFYINALIREFIANLSAEKKRHITNIIILFVYAIFISVVCYLTGIG